jgi:hypothetical protein
MSSPIGAPGATACRASRRRAGASRGHGLRRMHGAIDRFESMGARVGVSHFLCQLAEAELLAGRVKAAKATIGRSAKLLALHANAYHAADTARIQGLVAQAEGDTAA